MVSTALLVGLLIVASVTDIRWRKIYNWTTYPGIVAAVLLSGIASAVGVATPRPVILGTEDLTQTLGIISLADSLCGLLACGAVVIVCYVFFPGGVGGGDVKLIAMMGAFMGVMSGLEAMLWTFVLGACMALILLVWQYGVVTIISRTCRFVYLSIKLGGRFAPTDEERQPLKTPLFLAPSALLAALIVRFQLVDVL